MTGNNGSSQSPRLWAQEQAGQYLVAPIGTEIVLGRVVQRGKFVYLPANGLGCFLPQEQRTAGTLNGLFQAKLVPAWTKYAGGSRYGSKYAQLNMLGPESTDVHMEDESKHEWIQHRLVVSDLSLGYIGTPKGKKEYRFLGSGSPLSHSLAPDNVQAETPKDVFKVIQRNWQAMLRPLHPSNSN